SPRSGPTSSAGPRTSPRPPMMPHRRRTERPARTGRRRAGPIPALSLGRLLLGHRAAVGGPGSDGLALSPRSLNLDHAADENDRKPPPQRMGDLTRRNVRPPA